MPRCSAPGCVETDRSKFYEKSGRPGKFLSYCKVHFNENKKLDQRKKKMMVIDHKGGRCFICGYSKCINALELHHINPNDKDMDFGRMRNMSIDKIMKESEKCVLLCANCHREIHSGMATI